MSLYFWGHTISANLMAPKNSTELLDSIRVKNRSIEVNLEMFFLFITLWNQKNKWKKVLPTCTGTVAVIKPPVTWEKFDLPGWQILSYDCAKIQRERRMTSFDSYFCRSKYTQISFSAKKQTVKAVFSMNQIMSWYIHRLKTTSFKWTSHILSWHCGPLQWIKKGSRRREKKHRGWSRMWFKGREIVFIKEVASFVRFY